jgi:hypothetical protein
MADHANTTVTIDPLSASILQNLTETLGEQTETLRKLVETLDKVSAIPEADMTTTSHDSTFLDHPYPIYEPPTAPPAPDFSALAPPQIQPIHVSRRGFRQGSPQSQRAAESAIHSPSMPAGSSQSPIYPPYSPYFTPETPLYPPPRLSTVTGTSHNVANAARPVAVPGPQRPAFAVATPQERLEDQQRRRQERMEDHQRRQWAQQDAVGEGLATTHQLPNGGAGLPRHPDERLAAAIERERQQTQSTIRDFHEARRLMRMAVIYAGGRDGAYPAATASRTTVTDHGFVTHQWATSSQNAEPGATSTVRNDPFPDTQIPLIRPEAAQQDMSCGICLEDYNAGEVMAIVPCKGLHRFHSKCIEKWLAQYQGTSKAKMSCPFCRTELKFENVLRAAP